MKNVTDAGKGNPGVIGRFIASVRGADPGQRRAAGNIFKFLALFLVLTLIARGTSGVTLAKVELSLPQRATVVEAVKGNAVVSSRNVVEITAPEGLTIVEMSVGSGQSIRAGDAVARFDADEVRQKLERALAELDKALVDLEKLNRVEDADLGNRESAQRSLSRAREDYDAVRAQGEADVKDARDALDEALGAIGDDIEAATLESAIRSLQRATEDYDSVKAQGEADVAASFATLEEARENKDESVDDSALESAGRTLQRAKDDYASTKAQGEADVKAAGDAIDAAKKASGNYVDSNSVDTASRSLKRAKEDFDTVKAQGEADVKAAQDALDGADPADPDYGKLVQQLADAQKKADDNLLAAKRKVEDSEASLRNAEDAYYKNSQQSSESRQSDIDRAQSSYDAAKTKAQDNLLSAARRVEDAEAAYMKARQDYEKNVKQTSESRQTELDKAETAYENARAKAQENLLSANRRVEDAEVSLSKAENDFRKNEQQSADKILSDIEKAQTALKNAIGKADDNLLSAARRVEDAEVSLQKAEQDYDKSVRQATDTIVQNNASATLLRFDIDKQEKAVEELEKLVKNGGMLYSEADGSVSAAMSEGSVTGNAPVVSFRDGTKGHEAVMRLGKNDAAKLAVGDDCEVTVGGGSMYYIPTVTGVVSGISQPDDSDTSSVTIRLPDRDWTEGQRIEAQVLISSGNYDLCVPISALRSDNTGYYLFVVEQQNTVLGMQNIVVRVNVTVVASDDDMASVSGPLNRNSNVIVSSNKSVAHGDRVRVSEG